SPLLLRLPDAPGAPPAGPRGIVPAQDLLPLSLSLEDRVDDLAHRAAAAWVPRHEQGAAKHLGTRVRHGDRHADPAQDRQGGQVVPDVADLGVTQPQSAHDSIVSLELVPDAKMHLVQTQLLDAADHRGATAAR